jgi:hypothetical protein
MNFTATKLWPVGLSATRGVHNSDQSSKRGEIGAGILYPENVVVE